jgi:hypothetical protein
MDLRRDRLSDHPFGDDPDGADLPRGIHRIDVVYWLGVHSGIQAEPMSRGGLGLAGRAFCLMRHRDHFAGQPIGAEMRGARHTSIVTVASSATANLPLNPWLAVVAHAPPAARTSRITGSCDGPMWTGELGWRRPYQPTTVID